jgi:hypothetical protein
MSCIILDAGKRRDQGKVGQTQTLTRKWRGRSPMDSREGETSHQDDSRFLTKLLETGAAVRQEEVGVWKAGLRGRTRVLF